MRAFNDKDTRTNTCSYCRKTDHRAPDCKTAEYDHIEWSNHRVPRHSDSWYTWKRYDYTKWVKAAAKVAVMRERAAAKAAKKASGTTRVKSKCGFCGDSDHNRRNCDKMTEVVEAAKRANANWKRALYETFVMEMGICEGAAVKVEYRENYSSKVEGIGLITSVNWSDLNFLTSNKSIDTDYRTQIKIKVNVNGKTLNMNLKYNNSIRSDQGRIIIPTEYSYWYAAELLEVIGKSTKEFDEEWVTTAPEDEFAWLTKKRSYEWLRENSVISAITEWDWKK